MESIVRTCDCLSDGKHVDHAVDGRRGAVGVQRAHDEDAHLRGRHRDAHGLEVAQLADQDHVRILAQGRMQRGGETRAVHADLALADEAALALVHELDRVLDREDVALHARVDVVDHRRERGRFARAGLAGHQDEPVVGAAHLAHRLAAVFSSSMVSALEGMARNTAPMPFSCRMTFTRKRPRSAKV